MALRNTAWHQVEPGQIVTFLYKGKDSKRAVKRTILVLNPNLRYRKKSTKRVKSFVVGLQLDTAITPPITSTKLENLFGKIGGLEIEEGAIAGDLKDRMTPADTTRLYKKLKNLVSKYNNYRTFSRRMCLKRRVYLEVAYSKIPKDTLDEFGREMSKKFQNQLEGNDED